MDEHYISWGFFYVNWYLSEIHKFKKILLESRNMTTMKQNESMKAFKLLDYLWNDFILNIF